MEWYYETPSGRKGPVTSQILKKLFIDGHIDHNTLVWNTGMQNWIPIVQCMNLLYTDKPKAESRISYNPIEYAGTDDRDHLAVKAEETSRLVSALRFLAALSFITGLIVCVIYGKEASEYYGNEPKAILRAIAITSLISGIVGAVMFTTFAKILVYLNKIEINTRKDKNQL